MKLSVPAKTFLVGEYLALSGGPSLVITTAPRFELLVEPAPTEQVNPFHYDSPAGRLWMREKERLKSLVLKFVDPFQGTGGFGASTAQFGLLYAYLFKCPGAIEPTLSYSIRDRNFSEIMRLYRELAWDGKGHPPSGADLIAQLVGGITDFDGRSFTAEQCKWTFPEMVFTIVHTGVKLATHEHLKSEIVIPEERLRSLVQTARTALAEENATLLAESVESYGRTLAQAGLLSGDTASLLDALRKANDELDLGLIAAKACGAMGADVVIVLHKTKQANKLRGWFELRGQKICGTEADIGQGLQIVE